MVGIAGWHPRCCSGDDARSETLTAIGRFSNVGRDLGVMMSDRVLVLYGTTDGQTAKIAEAIARTLRACRLEADVVNARIHDPNVRPEDSVRAA